MIRIRSQGLLSVRGRRTPLAMRFNVYEPAPQARDPLAGRASDECSCHSSLARPANTDLRSRLIRVTIPPREEWPETQSMSRIVSLLLVLALAGIAHAQPE